MFDEVLKCVEWGLERLTEGQAAVNDGGGDVEVLPIMENAALAGWSAAIALVTQGDVTIDDARLISRVTLKTKDAKGSGSTTAYLVGIMAAFSEDIRSATMLMSAVTNDGMGPRMALRTVLKPPNMAAGAASSGRGSGMIRATAAAAVAALSRLSYAHPTHAHFADENRTVGPFRYLLEDGKMALSVLEADSAPCGIALMADQLEVATAESVMNIYLAANVVVDEEDATGIVDFINKNHRRGAVTGSLLATAVWGIARSTGTDPREDYIAANNRSSLLNAGGLDATTGLLLRYLPQASAASLERASKQPAAASRRRRRSSGGSDGKPAEQHVLDLCRYAVSVLWALIGTPPTLEDVEKPLLGERGVIKADEDVIYGVRLRQGRLDPQLPPEEVRALRALLRVSELPPHPRREELRALAMQAIWSLCYADTELCAAFLKNGLWRVLVKNVLCAEGVAMDLHPGSRTDEECAEEACPAVVPSGWEAPVRFTPCVRPNPAEGEPPLPAERWRIPALHLLLFLSANPSQFGEEDAATWRDDVAGILSRELKTVVRAWPYTTQDQCTTSGFSFPEIRAAFTAVPTYMEHAMAALMGVDMLTSSVSGARAAEAHPAFSKNLCRLLTQMRPWDIMREPVPKRLHPPASERDRIMGSGLVRLTQAALNPPEPSQHRAWTERFRPKIEEAVENLQAYDAWRFLRRAKEEGQDLDEVVNLKFMKSRGLGQNASMVAGKSPATRTKMPGRTSVEVSRACPVNTKVIWKHRWMALTATLLHETRIISCIMWSGRLEVLCKDVRGAEPARLLGERLEESLELHTRRDLALRRWYNQPGVPDPLLLTLKGLGALSGREASQVVIGRAAGRDLLDLTHSRMDDPDHTMHVLAARHALDQLKKHPGNVTHMYKLELESRLERPAQAAMGMSAKQKGKNRPPPQPAKREKEPVVDQLMNELNDMREVMANREEKYAEMEAKGVTNPLGLKPKPARPRGTFGSLQDDLDAGGRNNLPTDVFEKMKEREDVERARAEAEETRRAGKQRMMQPRRMLWREAQGAPTPPGVPGSPLSPTPPPGSPQSPGLLSPASLSSTGRRSSISAVPSPLSPLSPPPGLASASKELKRRSSLPGESGPKGDFSNWDPKIQEFKLTRPGEAAAPDVPPSASTHLSVSEKLLSVKGRDSRGVSSLASQVDGVRNMDLPPEWKVDAQGQFNPESVAINRAPVVVLPTIDAPRPEPKGRRLRSTQSLPSGGKLGPIGRRGSVGGSLERLGPPASAPRPPAPALSGLHRRPATFTHGHSKPSFGRSASLGGRPRKFDVSPEPIDRGTSFLDALDEVHEEMAMAEEMAELGIEVSPPEKESDDGYEFEEMVYKEGTSSQEMEDKEGTSSQEVDQAGGGSKESLSWDDQVPARVIFADAPSVTFEFDGPGRGRRVAGVVLFEHTEGCQICRGLYGHYRLPNGRLAHFYKSDRGPGFSIPVLTPPAPAVIYPTRSMHVGEVPSGSIPGICLPATDPATAGQRYLPRPELAPDPDQITLRAIEGAGYGDLQEDLLQMLVTPVPLSAEGRGLQLIGAERLEWIPPRPRTPFNLDASVFAPRKQEADCKGYYETPEIDLAMLDCVWKHMFAKPQARKMICRELELKELEGEAFEWAITRLKEELKVHWVTIRRVYEWFSLACGNGGDPFQLSFNGWIRLHQSLGVKDETSSTCKGGLIDAVYHAANYVDMTDNKDTGGQNSKITLNRHEFLEAMFRLAIAKYTADPAVRAAAGVPPGGDGLAFAMDRLCERHIAPCLPFSYTLDKNDFLRSRLYNAEVNLELKGTAAFPTLAMLREIYNIYTFMRRGSGMDTKGCRGVQMNSWIEFLDRFGFIGRVESCQLSIDEARVIYKQSMMTVVDEYCSQMRTQTLRWVDFLEAMSRVAEVLQLPEVGVAHIAGAIARVTTEDVSKGGKRERGIVKWGDDMLSGDHASLAAATASALNARDEAADDMQGVRVLSGDDTLRPLADKIRSFLALLFGRITRRAAPTADHVFKELKLMQAAARQTEYSSILRVGQWPCGNFLKPL